jgi:hypothetical protein
MGFGDTFGFYPYASDNGNVYNVKLSAADAAAGGFPAAVAPLANPPWPWHEKDLRHVTGFNSANKLKHGRLVIYIVTNPLFTTGGTWTNSTTTQTFTVLGAEGERRPASHLK